MEKVIALTSSCSTILAAAEIEGLSGWMAFLERMGSFALVAFLVWFAATKYMPQQQERFLAEMDRMREGYEKSRAEDRETVKELAEKLGALTVSINQTLDRHQ